MYEISLGEPKRSATTGETLIARKTSGNSAEVASIAPVWVIGHEFDFVHGRFVPSTNGAIKR